jgi:D-inositol-3-phosphate glycosyltransferase
MNVYVDRLARALVDLGVAVDVFTRSPGVASVREVAPALRVIALPAGRPAALAKEELTPHAPAFAGAIAAYALETGARYNIVHSHYWQSGIAAISLAKHWRTPLVHTHHTLGELKNQARPNGIAPEPDFRLRAERRIIAAAALVTASTDEERRRISGDDVRKLAPGVDHRLFHPGERKSARARLGLGEGPLFLAAGRIQALKGLELAVRALSLVDDASALIVAGGPSGADGASERERLARLACELDVERRVRFVGPQPQRRLADLYRAADAVIVCSYCESFGLAALEAHACGTPVVGTAVGGLPTFVREGRSGFLLDRRNPRLLAARLRDVLAAGEAFRIAAAQSASAFSWERMAQVLLAEYLRLTQPAYQSKMRLNASPYAKPTASPTTSNRRVNHCLNCA